MAERDYLTGASLSSAPAQVPDRTPDEIRQNIAATRESISNTVDRLSDRVHQAFDWRTYVTDYPLAAVGVAACFGFLVSGLFKRRQTPGERITEALAYAVEDLTDRFHHQLDSAGGRSSGLSRTVKAAAMGAITKAATDILRDRLIAGYQERIDQERIDLEESDDPFDRHR